MKRTEIESYRPFVNIYGFVCDTYPIDHKGIIESIKRDLSDAAPGDIVRIVSGEGNCEIYNPCGDYFKKYYQEKNLKYELIIGPVVSGCRENGKLRNKLLDLTKENIFETYLSKIRRELHMRITGNLVLRGEVPHPPVYGDRIGYSLDARKYQVEERQKAISAINNRIREVEAMKVFSTHISPDKVDEIPLLENWEIKKIDEMAIELGLNFGQLTQKEILNFRAKLKFLPM